MITRLRPLSTRFVLLQTLIAVSLLLSSLPFSVPAQVAAKRPINHNDYDSWRSIQSQQLSPDGKFLAYALIPEDGDGEVVVRNLATGTDWRQPIGHRPEPTAAGDGAEPVAVVTRAANLLSFTADSRNVVFTIFPNRADIEKAKRQKKRPEDMPKNGMGIMELSNGNVARVDRVRRFQVPEDSGTFIAYQLEAKPVERRADSNAGDNTEGVGSQNAGAQNNAGQNLGRRRAGARKEYGTDLVLRNMSDKSERTFPDALEFTISKDAGSLIYTVSSRKDETNGLYAVKTATADAPIAVITGKGRYTRLVWDDKQTQLAFLSDRDDAAAKQPKLKLYQWTREGKAAEELVSTETANFRKG